MKPYFDLSPKGEYVLVYPNNHYLEGDFATLKRIRETNPNPLTLPLRPNHVHTR